MAQKLGLSKSGQHFANYCIPPGASGGYFGLAFATPPSLRIERFSALTLKRKTTTARFTKFNLQVIFIGGESFSETEINLF